MFDGVNVGSIVGEMVAVGVAEGDTFVAVGGIDVELGAMATAGDDGVAASDRLLLQAGISRDAAKSKNVILVRIPLSYE